MKRAEQPNRSIALAFGVFVAVIATAILAQAVPASGADLAPLVIGPRTLPVPTGEVSPEMQPIIAIKPNTSLSPSVKTGEETRVLADAFAAIAIKTIPGLLTRLN